MEGSNLYRPLLEDRLPTETFPPDFTALELFEGEAAELLRETPLELRVLVLGLAAELLELVCGFTVCCVAEPLLFEVDL